eukprot:gene18438-24913_t
MRDPSPSYHRHRSPPPRGYDDRYDDYDMDPRRGGPPPPPPPGRRPADDTSGKMMSFKQFMLEQPDDPSVEDAQARYKQYTVEYHGGEIKAEFMAQKDDEEVQAMFDPRMFEKALAERNEEAKSSATQFHADVEAGKMDASSAGFNQGMFEAAQLPPKPQGKDGAAGATENGAAPAEGGEAVTEAPTDEPAEESIFAPSMCWRPTRVATDLKLAAKLIRKLDSEKGIRENALLPGFPEGDTAAPAEGDAPMADGDAATPKKVADKEDTKDPDAVDVDEANLAEMTGRMDVLLTYLWRVHGIDYYAGYELQGGEFPQRLIACRLLRGLRPEEVAVGDTPADAEAAKADEERDAELVSKTVDETWDRRMEEGDPMELRIQRKRVDDILEEWVESQILSFSDNKWGNKLSQKLFVAKKFVVKHIKVKHEDKTMQEKNRIIDEIYFENFKAFKEEEAANAEVEPPRHEPPPPVEEVDQGEGPVEGYEGGPPGMRGGRGGGRMVGRGPRGRGGRYGGRMGPMGMMEMGGMGVMPGMGGMMPGMHGGMMGMGGAMFIPAPGAGPMGPFLPMMQGPSPAAPMMLPMGGRRGGGRMGGPRGGGRMGGRGMSMGMGIGGRGMDGGPMREYFDLDNPQNNRAVLDYGDL